MTAIEIVDAGVASTVQDGGRPGFGHIGVSPSGSVDPHLADVMNRLVGNIETAAVIETCGNLVFRAERPVVVAATTEPSPRVVRRGETYTVRPGGDRLWHYVAVRGGIAVEPVLGSRATDTLSSIGPPPLVAGVVLPIGLEPDAPIVADVAPLARPSNTARLSIGPRATWFADGWQTQIVSHPCTVTSSSRVGVRLTGHSFERTVTDELPSEGLVRGAVQVLPDGDLVMMLADHPTTGGYPVIAVVHPDDVADVAQHPVGAALRFRM